MVSSDSLFHALPKELQGIIDEAFIATVHPNSHGFHKPTSKPSPPKASNSGGDGFPFGGNEPAGGFLIGDELENVESEKLETPDQILLDLIPPALQRLDLPPDDPEVLAVFRNAASGWISASLNTLDISHSAKTYVSRDDWRSVCAVLLENRASEFEGGELLNFPNLAQMDEEDDEDASMTDDYVEDKSSSQSDLEEDSDEEYQEAGRNSRHRGNCTTGSKRPFSPPQLLSEKSGQPSSRQRQTSLNTFALFFPEVPLPELSKQKIMVADIQRVAKLLGEKIKADEVSTRFLKPSIL